MIFFKQNLPFLRSDIHMDLQSEDKGEIFKMGIGRSGSFATDLISSCKLIQAMHAFHVWKQGPDLLHSKNLLSGIFSGIYAFELRFYS